MPRRRINILQENKTFLWRKRRISTTTSSKKSG